MRQSTARRLAVGLALVGAVLFALGGVWALAAPHSFFDVVAPYPPYNRHLFHDVGAFQLGIAAAFLAGRRGLAVGLWGGAVGASAHAVSHWIDDPGDRADRSGDSPVMSPPPGGDGRSGPRWPAPQLGRRCGSARRSRAPVSARPPRVVERPGPSDAVLQPHAHATSRGPHRVESLTRRDGVAQRPQFQDLYVARRGAVRATAYLLCGDWHLAEDLAQAAFVRMYQRWGRLQHWDDLDAYLHRTVVRLWIDETRRRRHRDTLVAEPPETQEHADPALPDPDLLRALRRLPPRQRACVVLRYFNDLSVAQTAELLSCTTGTVKSQTSRALDALRAHLGVDVVDAVETKEKSE